MQYKRHHWHDRRQQPPHQQSQASAPSAIALMVRNFIVSLTALGDGFHVHNDPRDSTPFNLAVSREATPTICDCGRAHAGAMTLRGEPAVCVLHRDLKAAGLSEENLDAGLRELAAAGVIVVYPSFTAAGGLPVRSLGITVRINDAAFFTGGNSAGTKRVEVVAEHAGR